jgi:hypothetical protein
MHRTTEIAVLIKKQKKSNLFECYQVCQYFLGGFQITQELEPE